MIARILIVDDKAIVIRRCKRTRNAEETGVQRSNCQAIAKKHNIRVRDTENDPGASEST